MKHVVQFSTGIGSGEVLRRVVERYGPSEVLALTADTLAEDPDNWRYGREVIDWLGCEWVVLADGRTPMEAGRQRGIVPSDRMPACSFELKIKLLRRWIEEHCDPADSVIYLGFDWTEGNRIRAAQPKWVPFTVAFPMAEEPFIEKWALLEEWPDRWGIKPPSMYAEGYSHANCGGCCVRQGQVDWKRTLLTHPDRYAAMETEEEATRQLLVKDVAMMRQRSGPDKGKALTLRTFRERLQVNGSLFDADDVGTCGCTLPAAPE